MGFNALFLDPGVSGGPETYLRGLLPAIARAHPSLELTIVTTRRGARALRADGWADFARISVYSDSVNDLALLEKATDPVATNPSPELEAIARVRGWRILNLFA